VLCLVSGGVAQGFLTWTFFLLRRHSVVHPSFDDYLAQLKRAPVALAMPVDMDWQTHLDGISVPEQTTLISKEDFCYWLQVVPPRWKHASHFCIADGDQEFRLFWVEAGSYFVRQLTTDETLLFCSLADIRPPAI
jgi:hypothetical protein